MKELPGVRVFFLLGMARDQNTQVRYIVHREKKLIHVFLAEDLEEVGS